MGRNIDILQNEVCGGLLSLSAIGNGISTLSP
jgi:hypothetical protein